MEKPGQQWRARRPAPLAELFAAEPDRLQRLAMEEAGIRFDFAKTHLTAASFSPHS